MTRQDKRPDPSNPAKTAEPPGSAAESEPPRAPFAPPVQNPSVLAILNGLNPSVTPVPMEIATTDGELAASFSAGPRPAPIAEPTPGPEASVVVKPAKAPRRSEDPQRVDTTFRLRPRKYPASLPILIGVGVVGLLVALWFARAQPEHAPQVTSASAAPVGSASPPVVPAAPGPAFPALPPVAASPVEPIPSGLAQPRSNVRPKGPVSPRTSADAAPLPVFLAP